MTLSEALEALRNGLTIRRISRNEYEVVGSIAAVTGGTFTLTDTITGNKYGPFPHDESSESFALTLNGHTTGAIPMGSGASVVQAAIRKLPGFGGVNVESNGDGTFTLDLPTTEDGFVIDG